ncbi:MAG: hypothetical protein EBX52_13030, partial [Proteobacteria bacterium]|nr:hypothetical protein [Pseudomonadota bacterium]
MRSLRLRVLTAFALALTLQLSPACSKSSMPKYSTLQSLRVIALTLDHPEVEFNPALQTFTPSTIQLTPVISDLYGAGRSLTYRLYHCLDPGVGLGAVPTCTGNPTKTDVGTVAIPLPSDDYSAPNYTGAMTPVSIDLSLISASAKAVYAARFSALSSAQRYNGYAVLVFFEIFPTGDESKKETFFKRLILSDSSKAAKNQNPSGLDFQVSGVSMTALPAAETGVDAFVPASQLESYSSMNADGSLQSQTESIETTWFLTGPEDVACSKD